MNIPIVIAAYNRPESLQRLLESIANSDPPEGQDLIISIDGANREVNIVAKEFDWQRGEKRIIVHSQQLGLSPHIIECFKLGLVYDGIILLEDDVWLSPVFWKFLPLACRRMEEDDKIAATALYHQFYYPATGLRRFENHLRCYLSPLPCSWGVIMLYGQLTLFIDWLQKHGLETKDHTPSYMNYWHDKGALKIKKEFISWERAQTAYFIEHNKLVLYPPGALVTNYSAAGEHHRDESNFFQSPLLNAEDVDESLFRNMAQYDLFFNPSINVVKPFLKEHRDLNFSLDLFGSLQKDDVNTPYLLSCRKCRNPIKQWSGDLLPLERNIQFNLRGTDLSLGKTEDFYFSKRDYLNLWQRIFPPRSLSILASLLIREINRRIKLNLGLLQKIKI